MKDINNILANVQVKQLLNSNSNIAVEGLTFDSRQVAQNTLFVAIKGTNTDGHQYIEKAIAQGATAIVCETLPEKLNPTITYILVDNSHRALATIAKNYFGNPADKLKIVGVTGTNGKTTCATLLYNLFKELGYKCGLVSTIQNKIDDETLPSTHTTPDAIQLNQLFAQMVQKGCQYCFMEVSSHALDQQRVAGINFTGAIFTNITHDHLDYHQTFSNYIKAKKLLFDNLQPNAFALVNADDKHAGVMLQNCKANTKRFYSLQTMSDFKTKIIDNNFAGLQLEIDGFEVWTRMIGKFNAYNLTAVYAAAILLGQDKVTVLTALSKLKSAEGRFDHITNPKNIIGIVDYAHTPDALKNVLSTIQAIKQPDAKIITVVGCGGDRDKEKRPKMAKIAADMSQKVILTADNPRSEEPEAIVEDMKRDLEYEHNKKVLTIIDRKEAIRTACALATTNDIILVAGKGHEKYQEIKGRKYPFDDMAILSENLMLEKTK